MKIFEKEKKKFVRVLIGNAETGNPSLLPPRKSIPIENATVDEVYKKIKKMVKKEGEK